MVFSVKSTCSRAGRVRQGVGPTPTFLNYEIHGVWTHSLLPVLLSDGTSHLPHNILPLAAEDIFITFDAALTFETT